ncbi:HlyD family secretion protein [Endozoicomonas sp. ONNA2]|uniref:HlyD family secretion protein n=1 Tax=Endozoicomonas sp. ONNA2 TaxID=2828741 RepID=UPI002147D048|nr:HlyD family secretion protein [Endozoicomonas sp. ONNA2]
MRIFTQNKISPVLIVAASLMLALASIIAFAYPGYLLSRSVNTDNAYIRGDIIPVSSSLSGHIVEFLVRDFEKVSVDQPLFTLDTTRFELNRQQQLAEINRLKAKLAAYQAQKEAHSLAIKQNVVACTAAASEVDHARAQLHRLASLLDKGGIAEEKYTTAKSELDLLQLKYEASELTVQLSRQQQLTLESEASAMQFHLEQAQTTLARIEQDLLDSTIKAPADGVIGQRHTHPGQFIAPGTTALLLIPEKPLWLIANIKESQVTQIKTGQSVTIMIDALPHIPFNGRVHEIAPAANSEFSPIPARQASGYFTRITQTIPVKIHLAPSEALAKLKAGMSAKVIIATGGH